MSLAITFPEPLRVLQRDPAVRGGGLARVRIRGTGAAGGTTRASVRTLLAASGDRGEETDWTEADVVVDPDGTFTTAPVELCGGGWFRLELRLGGAETFVEPIGIGEVFVVAGQSYAASCHECATTVADPLGRVVACSPEQPSWRIADDPQPGIRTRIDPAALAELYEQFAGRDLRFPLGPHSPFRGSIWPTFADHLVELLGTPVALVHAAVSGTRVGRWQPGTQLFTNVCDAVALAGDFRALLWQQGESDAMAATPTEEYAALLRKFRAGVVTVTGLDRPWLLAKSTHHPTDSERPEAEEQVRAAITEVAQEPGFARGPDTDQLRGPDYRASLFRGGHFTARGQRAAALMWVTAVTDLLGPAS